jgi:hypothetical protein
LSNFSGVIFLLNKFLPLILPAGSIFVFILQAIEDKMLTIIMVYVAVSIFSICIVGLIMRSAPRGWEEDGKFYMEDKNSVKILPKKISILRKSNRKFSKVS